MNKKLHILIIAFLSFWLGNAQVPANDLIENAVLVPSGTFIDSNLRLDLATNTGIGGSDCGVETFNRVYYKFTAAIDNTVVASLVDPNFQFVDPNSFLIPYTAPDLNQTNEAQLLVIPNYCAFSTSSTFNVVAGQSYYVQVHRGNSANLTTDVTFSTPEDGSAVDRTALTDFYNANGGANWTNNTNWTSTLPLGSWHGVTVENGRVTRLALQSNNIQGNDLSMLPNLDAIEFISFNDNKLSGTLPDFSILTDLTFLSINNNNFSFADLETNYTANTALTEFTYQTQNSGDAEQNIEVIIGSDYAITMTPVAGTNVSYQWYRANRFTQDVTSNPVAGATSSFLTFTNIQSPDLDTYVCWATSPIITDLIIRRPRIDLYAEVSQAERDALIIFYNSLDGPNWTENTNWGTLAPVKDWAHVTTAGNRVIALDFFGVGGLTGQIPTEIEDLVNLEYLGIGIESGVTGPLPSSIGNLTELKRLRIQGTGNSGALPASIGNLSNLEELRLIGNAFIGDIPSTFNNLTSLKDFYVIGSGFVFGGNFNLFTGALPAFPNSPDLFRIQVSGNDFTGELPDYGSLPNMTNLFIDDNLFSFADLATNQTSNLTITNYIFSPQRNNSTAQSVQTPPGQSVTFDANSNTSTGRIFWERLAADEYQWFKDGAEIVGATASTYTISNPQPTDNGVYYCEITNTDVADLIVRRADITLNVNAALTIDDVELEDFKLYPNPATSWLAISASGLQDATAEVYDLSGRLVQRNTLNANTNVLNIEGINSGIYIIRITNSENKTTSKRFIKR